jgi:penicillin-binding protein 1A
MANAYATLASGGMHNKPIAIRKVTFPNGETDDLGEPQRNRVFDDGVAYEVTQILQDNVDGGTGTAAQPSTCSEVAGKTGTTDDFNDAMFIGYTPNLSTGVWVGYPDALRSMTSVHGISVAGGTFPAQIWHDYSEVALRNGCPTFPEPQNPVEWIDFSGEYSSDSSYSSCSEGSVTGSGSSEGSYSCAPAEPVEETDEDNRDDGAYAPGRGQKPAPAPKPKPKPAPPPPPPPPAPPVPPSGGTTP